MEDEYKIRLLGTLNQGIDSHAAQKALSAIFNVSPKNIERYLDGKKRVIKQGLSFGEAKKYQAIFNRIGALSEIDVVFDRRILEDSSIFIEGDLSQAKQQPDVDPYSPGSTFAAEPEAVDRQRQKNQEPVSYFLQSTGFQFDAYRFIPPVFSGPGCVPITSPQGAEIGVVQSTKPVLGSALTLLAAVISAFVIHRLGLNFVLARFSTASFVAPVIIFVFLMSLIFLPKILRLRKVLCVTVSDSGKQRPICRLRERKWGWPFTREFIVEDDSKRDLAHVKKNQFFLSYACTTEAGKVIYRADPDMDIEESIAYFGESGREELFTVAALIVQGFGMIKSIANFMKTKGRDSNKKVIDIFDERGSVAASLKINKSPFKKPRMFTLLVKGGTSSDADRRILLAFGLLLAGL